MKNDKELGGIPPLYMGAPGAPSVRVAGLCDPTPRLAAPASGLWSNPHPGRQTAENLRNKLTRLMQTDPLVSRLIHVGTHMDECVVVLGEDRKRLMARIMELEAIAPRRLKMPDGREMVWHCPDHLIPVTDCTATGFTAPSADRPLPGPLDTGSATPAPP